MRDTGPTNTKGMGTRHPNEQAGFTTDLFVSYPGVMGVCASEKTDPTNARTDTKTMKNQVDEEEYTISARIVVNPYPLFGTSSSQTDVGVPTIEFEIRRPGGA